MKKKVPRFKNREEEARFWETHSVADYIGDLKKIDRIFTVAPGLAESIRERALTKAISLRLPVWAIAGAKKVAQKKGVGYQVLIKNWISECLQREADH
ncbi:MAG: CopG family antitoxin [Elusimicrobiota bacterium]